MKPQYDIRRLVRFGFLLGVSLLFTASVVKGQTNRAELEIYEKLMAQRASFHTSGTVVDGQGMPLTNVTLSVTKRAFVPATLSTLKSGDTQLVDCVFEVFVDDATSLELRASKDGHHTATAAYHHSDLYNAKRRSQKVKSGLNWEQQYAIYGDLQLEDTNVVLVLKKFDGPLADSVPGHVSFDVEGSNMKGGGDSSAEIGESTSACGFGGELSQEPIHQ